MTRISGIAKYADGSIASNTTFVFSNLNDDSNVINALTNETGYFTVELPAQSKWQAETDKVIASGEIEEDDE